MTSFDLSIDQRMLRVWNVTLENLKNRDTSRYLGNFNFSEAVYIEF